MLTDTQSNSSKIKLQKSNLCINHLLKNNIRLFNCKLKDYIKIDIINNCDSFKKGLITLCEFVNTHERYDWSLHKSNEHLQNMYDSSLKDIKNTAKLEMLDKKYREYSQKLIDKQKTFQKN